MFNFLESALTPFQSKIIGKIDIAHASLADALTNAITAAQYISFF
jgi:hypothetical protein